MSGKDFAEIRRAVCAVGFLRVAIEDLSGRDALASLEVVGTGFVVNTARVLTCTHVLEELKRQLTKRKAGQDRAVVQFGYSLGGLWQTQLHHFRVQQTHDDVTMLRILGTPAQPIKPVSVVDRAFIPTVGDEIALCGYAHGSALLNRGKRVVRFGPVLQRGVVAAVAPFEGGHNPPSSVLLDLLTGEAASGSPVWSISTGKVFGILKCGPTFTSTCLDGDDRRAGRAVMIPSSRRPGPLGLTAAKTTLESWGVGRRDIAWLLRHAKLPASAVDTLR